MAFGDAIYSILNGDATVTAITSSRIYPLRIPQGAALPAITYFIVSGDPFNTRDGAVTDNFDSFQVSCFTDANTTDAYKTLQSLYDAVLGALERYSGTAASTVIHTITYLGHTDLYEEDAGVYHRAIDFRIWLK